MRRVLPVLGRLGLLASTHYRLITPATRFITARRTGDWRAVPRWPIYLGTAILLVSLAPVIGRFSPPLLLQLTPSEPRGVYWLRALPESLTPGMLVTLRVPSHVATLVFDHGWLPRSWHGADTVLVKPVAAVAGDEFCVGEHGVWINGTWQGPVYRELGGVVLPVLRGCWTVQPDQVLLLSTRIPNSLDGRYMGVVHRDALLRQAVPLWTWD